jgi:hypothetical protein
MIFRKKIENFEKSVYTKELKKKILIKKKLEAKKSYLRVF